MSFQAKDANIQSRSLAAQSCIIVADLVAGTSDLPSNITIDNSTIATTLITLDVNETISKVFSVRAFNRITGAVLPLLTAAPVVSGETIRVTINGTGIADASIEFIYKVTE